MSIRIGGVEAADIRVGNQRAVAVYVGTVKVWPSAPAAPSAVTGVRGQPFREMVRVTWNAVAGDVGHYEIRRNSMTPIVLGKVLTYDMPDPGGGVGSFMVNVRAVNSKGVAGPWSVNQAVKSYPAAPTLGTTRTVLDAALDPTLEDTYGNSGPFPTLPPTSGTLVFKNFSDGFFINDLYSLMPQDTGGTTRDVVWAIENAGPHTIDAGWTNESNILHADLIPSPLPAGAKVTFVNDRNFNWVASVTLP